MMDMTTMSVEELNEVIRTANLLRDKKIRNEQEEKWNEFIKVWKKTFKQDCYYAFELNENTYEASEILNMLEDAFFYEN